MMKAIDYYWLIDAPIKPTEKKHLFKETFQSWGHVGSKGVGYVLDHLQLGHALPSCIGDAGGGVVARRGMRSANSAFNHLKHLLASFWRYHGAIFDPHVTLRNEI